MCSWPEAWALLTATEQRFTELRGPSGGLAALGQLLTQPQHAAAERMARWAAERGATASLDAAYWQAASHAGVHAQAPALWILRSIIIIIYDRVSLNSCTLTFLEGTVSHDHS